MSSKLSAGLVGEGNSEEISGCLAHFQRLVCALRSQSSFELEAPVAAPAAWLLLRLRLRIRRAPRPPGASSSSLMPTPQQHIMRKSERHCARTPRQVDRVVPAAGRGGDGAHSPDAQVDPDPNQRGVHGHGGGAAAGRIVAKTSSSSSRMSHIREEHHALHSTGGAGRSSVALLSRPIPRQAGVEDATPAAARPCA